MKRILALVLAVMMLGSVTVFAANEDPDNSLTPSETKEFDVSEDNKSASQHTDIWLQVEASGQIDVTVPLLLVFKTNIDGGAASTPNNYLITNKSSAPLVVTKIVTTVEAKDAKNPMTLVDYKEGGYDEDTYGVQLSFAAESTNKDVTIDLHHGTEGKDADDKVTHTQEEETKGAGIFVLDKATAAGTPTPTDVIVTMETGDLSFVTKNTDGELDTKQGVKLLSIAYTVAIKHDNASAKGDYIEGETTFTTYDDDGVPTKKQDYSFTRKPSTGG